MNGRIYYLLTFTVWITILCSCGSPISATTIACRSNQKLCGDKFCYDPTTQFCSETGSVLTCINACAQQCFDSSIQICLNNTLCPIGSDLCEVKYDINSGNIVEPPQLQCYDPRSQRCLNHTICYKKDRVCNGQCISGTYPYQHQVCANDNVTLCNVPQSYYNYKPNQIQLCNGSCYDAGYPPLKHCVNGDVQCIFNCSNRCYDPTQQRCLNDTLCPMEYDLCYPGQCYHPPSQRCLNSTVCSNDHVCGGQCISNYYQVCANDKHTLCNVTSSYNNYRPYQMHLCNGKCFDTSLQQCINGNVSCIDDICGNQCYNSAFHVCINGVLCSVGHDLCEVKYDTYGGHIIEPPQLQCYNPWSQRCLNHMICYEKDRVCNGQCIPNNSSYRNLICANDNMTLCRVQNQYTYYKPNQIQVCNGSCFDTGYPPLRHCVNGNVQCILNCSNTCYDPLQYRCLNDTPCLMGYDLCYPGRCYYPSSEKCLNGTVCSYTRVCGGQCITDNNQVCASDQKTVCNVPNSHSKYKSNQIKLCRGVCYDSLMQECPVETEISCIHDPDTQICVPQNISSSTTTISSPSTINNISSHGWINSSDFSMGTSAVSSPTATSDVERLSSSMNSLTTDNAASSSIESDSTSPSTTVTDLLAESSSYETTIADTTAFLATQTSITSVETLLGTGSHSSDSFTSTTESPSQAAVSFASIPSITSTALLKDTDATSMSSDLTTSSISSNPSSVSNSRSNVVPTLETSGTNLDTSSGSIQTPPSSLPSSSDDMVLTTERPSQTTLTSTSEFPLHGSCGATKVCANGTSCCSPHVEYRCYQHNRTRDYGQTCRTIVIGESNNDSFVIAIAFNDNKVIIININNFLVVLLPIIIAFSLLVLVPMAYVIITHRKQLAVHFRVGYIFLRNHLTNSQRTQWETHPET